MAAFLAATLLPLSSEVVLTALIVQGDPVVTLVIVASIGNVLGSLTNYALGLYAGRPLAQRWLSISDKTLNEAEGRFRRYGLWSLTMCWVPVIGDPLTVVAGLIRVPVIWFVFIVSIAKTTRYIILSQMVLATLSA
ncbi:YqaA family protein [Alteromonas sp. ASW11-36]|uniref:YqaA family protein n=1 Tax=Alteromonas arenosi TaxID=3055817 RepID=A0ABT7SU42_9ALTE|nr:YqaA family protein [Alteromonas sp. ASW11-36]MDM7859034.1 YqaA family protein [Alteromonas sp. ASW11-36]